MLPVQLFLDEGSPSGLFSPPPLSPQAWHPSRGEETAQGHSSATRAFPLCAVGLWFRLQGNAFGAFCIVCTSECPLPRLWGAAACGMLSEGGSPQRCRSSLGAGAGAALCLGSLPAWGGLTRRLGSCSLPCWEMLGKIWGLWHPSRKAVGAPACAPLLL